MRAMFLNKSYFCSVITYNTAENVDKKENVS